MELYVSACNDASKAPFLQAYAARCVKSMYDWPYCFDTCTLFNMLLKDAHKPPSVDMEACKRLWKEKIDEIREDDAPYHAWMEDFVHHRFTGTLDNNLNYNTRNVRDIVFACVVLKPRLACSCGEEGFHALAKHLVSIPVWNSESLSFFLARSLPRSTLRLQAGVEYTLTDTHVSAYQQLAVRTSGRGRARIALNRTLTFEGAVTLSNLVFCKPSNSPDMRSQLICDGVSSDPAANLSNLVLQGVELHITCHQRATCTGVKILGAVNGLNAHYIRTLTLTDCEVSSGGMGLFGTHIQELKVDELRLTKNRDAPICCWVERQCDLSDVIFAENGEEGVIRMPGPEERVCTIAGKNSEGSFIGRLDTLATAMNTLANMYTPYHQKAFHLYSNRELLFERKPIPPLRMWIRPDGKFLPFLSRSRQGLAHSCPSQSRARAASPGWSTGPSMPWRTPLPGPSPPTRRFHRSSPPSSTWRPPTRRTCAPSPWTCSPRPAQAQPSPNNPMRTPRTSSPSPSASATVSSRTARRLRRELFQRHPGATRVSHLRSANHVKQIKASAMMNTLAN